MSSLFGANNKNIATSTTQEQQTTQGTIQNVDNIVQERAPIINEQHVYTQANVAPEIREKHVVREQHLTQEVPVIEKKIIHERPVVQEKTIVHEKPIVHEKKVITNEEKVVREAPLVERQADQVVREAPTVIRDENIHRQNDQTRLNDSTTTTTHDNESKPGFFGSLFGGAKNEEKKEERKLENEEANLKNQHNLDNNSNTASSGGMLKNLFSSNVPRPFATTTYDYGTAGSTTVAASVPGSDLNTASTLPNGPVDNQAAFAHNNKISSA